jgi:hypothetical protein
MTCCLSDVITSVHQVRFGRFGRAGWYTISRSTSFFRFSTISLFNHTFPLFLILTMTLDYVSTAILYVIKLIDSLGAESWSATAVVLSSLGILFAIKVAVNNKRGVDWYCLFHAIITGVGSCMCVWLNTFAAETMTGTSGALMDLPVFETMDCTPLY